VSEKFLPGGQYGGEDLTEAELKWLRWEASNMCCGVPRDAEGRCYTHRTWGMTMSKFDFDGARELLGQLHETTSDEDDLAEYLRAAMYCLEDRDEQIKGLKILYSEFTSETFKGAYLTNPVFYHAVQRIRRILEVR
jgi:hypothetical protein